MMTWHKLLERCWLLLVVLQTNAKTHVSIESLFILIGYRHRMDSPPKQKLGVQLNFEFKVSMQNREIVMCGVQMGVIAQRDTPHRRDWILIKPDFNWMYLLLMSLWCLQLSRCVIVLHSEFSAPKPSDFSLIWETALLKVLAILLRSRHRHNLSQLFDIFSITNVLNNKRDESSIPNYILWYAPLAHRRLAKRGSQPLFQMPHEPRCWSARKTMAAAIYQNRYKISRTITHRRFSILFW